MIKIDKRKAIQLLEQAVAERGEDYVYGEHFKYCEYTSHPELANYDDMFPACVVGVAMVNAGIPVEVLDDITGPVEDLVVELRERGEAKISESAARILNAAQRVQDASITGVDAITQEALVRGEQTWGKALAAAKAVAGV